MNSIKHKNIALSGAIICLLAVAIGAFGAHAFKELLIENQREAVFELANRYQFYHGLGLLIIATLFQNFDDSRLLVLVKRLMTAGVLIFSGSLYALAISNVTWLGAITPIGGSLLIAAWAMLILRIIRS